MRILLAAAAFAALAAAPAFAQERSAEELAFREIYRELVEIDTSPSTGNCTRAAEAMAVRLRAAGFPESDLRVIVPEGRPDDGNLVAVIRGTSRRAVLLLAHIDVVDAKPEDWTRDPFTLVEENGFFYGRGSADDKSMAAVFADMFINMRRENYRPRRTIRLALTCGEETSNRINGVDYILNHHRDWIQADFAINEGAGGVLTADGRPLMFNIQAGEKIHQVYTLEVTNPGGHSSRPVPENAIYHLARALDRVSELTFPTEITPVTRAFFERMAPIVGGETGEAMARLGANPSDAEAITFLSRDPSYNAMLRTTCVATQIDAGHAPNALPQRALATLSCRVMQSTTPETVRDALAAAIDNPSVNVEIVRRRGASSPPQLTREIMAPVERAVEALWPGTPIVPIMQVGATDGRFLNNAGIPTYGMSGVFAVPGEANAHGLNENVRVDALYRAREFLNRIVRDYAR
ncbi:MAG TPA: M20/M25/M40 family metallo-hydrolase [Terricaulis sp.]|nr:M20/M25/M40 family metallo-hydrolase [Terricaulis sp.]